MDLCPDCGHGHERRTDWVDWLTRKLGRKPRGPFCEFRVETIDSMCGCRNQHHA